jgi:hypothetical protein
MLLDCKFRRSVLPPTIIQQARHLRRLFHHANPACERLELPRGYLSRYEGIEVQGPKTPVV